MNELQGLDVEWPVASGQSPIMFGGTCQHRYRPRASSSANNLVGTPPTAEEGRHAWQEGKDPWKKLGLPRRNKLHCDVTAALTCCEPLSQQNRTASLLHTE